jgi:Aldehyde dehydrogenase family
MARTSGLRRDSRSISNWNSCSSGSLDTVARSAWQSSCQSPRSFPGPSPQWTAGSPTQCRLANASEYGLASYLYSRDFNRLLRVAEQIEFGLVGFNASVIPNAAAPFGGVKQSGLGREGGQKASLNTPPPNTSASQTPTPARKAHSANIFATHGVIPDYSVPRPSSLPRVCRRGVRACGCWRC